MTVLSSPMAQWLKAQATSRKSAMAELLADYRHS